MALFVVSIQPSLKPRSLLLLRVFAISALVGAYLLITARPVFKSEFVILREPDLEPDDETISDAPIRIVTWSGSTPKKAAEDTQQSKSSTASNLRTNAANLSQDSQRSSSPSPVTQAPSLPKVSSSPSVLLFPQAGSSPQARSSPQAGSSPQSRSSPQAGSSPQARSSPSPQAGSSPQARSSPQAGSSSQARPRKRPSNQASDTRSRQNQVVASQRQPSPLKVDFSELLAPSSAPATAQRSQPLPEEASLPSPSQPSRVAIAPPSPAQRKRPLPLPEEPTILRSPAPSAPALPPTAARPEPQPAPPAPAPSPEAAKPQPAPEITRVEPPPREPVQPSAPIPLPKPASPQSIPEAVPQAAARENVFVERFEVVGSTIFSPEALALAAGEAVTPKPSEALPEGVEVNPTVLNRVLSLAELLQASEAITRLYTDQGYINSGAYVPQDALRDGIATIRVIEGSLEAININLNNHASIPTNGNTNSIRLEDINITPSGHRSRSLLANPSYITSNWLDPNPVQDRFFITGNRPLNLGYIRSRLALAGSTPLNLNRLLAGVQLLQLNPLIDSISTEIAKGTQTGTSILNVELTQADTSDIQLSIDNGRSPSVGSIRQRAQISQGNFLGLGDRLLLGYSRTEGSDGWDASYTLPINARNGTLSFSLGSTSSEVIEDPFNFLDIQSASRYYELTLRQPVILTPTEEFTLSLTASRRESESEFLENLTGQAEPFPAIGADEEGRTQISALRFGQEWTKQGEQDVLALQSEFSLGLNAFNSTINPIPPDSRFFAWRGRGQWVRRLGPETLLLLRGEIQLADRPLLPLEQFGLGGQNTVRGYRQDTLLTDNGWLAAAELRVPILRIPEIGGVLQLTPFLEIGKGWNRGDSPDPDPNTLASTGIGLLWRQGDFTARLDWGIPLTSVSSSGETLQENGFHFSVIYSPF